MPFAEEARTVLLKTVSEVCCLEVVILRTRPNCISKGNSALYLTWLFSTCHVQKHLDVTRFNSDSGNFALGSANVQLNRSSERDELAYFPACATAISFTNTHQVCPACGTFTENTSLEGSRPGCPWDSPTTGLSSPPHSRRGLRSHRSCSAEPPQRDTRT